MQKTPKCLNLLVIGNEIIMNKVSTDKKIRSDILQKSYPTNPNYSEILDTFRKLYKLTGGNVVISNYVNNTQDTYYCKR